MFENNQLQKAILQKHCVEKNGVTVYLMNGYLLHGTIDRYDETVVVLVTAGKEQMIYKHAISTIVAGEPPQKSRSGK